MAYDIEVTDKLGTWGTRGRIFRPGVYRVDDMDIVEAAMNQPGIKVRHVAEGGDVADVEYGTADGPTGQLTAADMKGGEPTAYKCEYEECGETLGSWSALTKHYQRVHGGAPVAAPSGDEAGDADDDGDADDLPFTTDVKTEET